MIQHMMFDFDGTLADTSEGIIKSMHYAFDQLKIPRVEDQAIADTIGAPLEDMFAMLLKIDDEVYIKNCVELFRERYRSKGIQELSLYPGVKETLKQLIRKGKKLYIVTSKPEVFVKQICEANGVLECFLDITGVSLEKVSLSKGQRMKEIMSKYDMTPDNAVMVGDRPEDAIAAKENQVPCIGLEYGFSTKDNLIQAGCVKTGSSFSQLLELI